MVKRHLKLCLVTNLQEQPFPQYKEFILQAIKGGITSIQLREKSRSLSEIRQMALELKAILTVPLILNDHVEIVKEVGAEGVHLGQSDMHPEKARALVGPNKIIGLSIESYQELKIANSLTCIDYVAASAVFPSKIKRNTKTIWGLEGLYTIVKNSRHPVIAIGGINESNIQSIVKTGACGAAVVGAIHDHPCPTKAAARLINQMKVTCLNQ